MVLFVIFGIMNLEELIAETKEYVHRMNRNVVRGDLHTLPRIHREDLMNYLQSLHHFPKARFVRFIDKLKSRRLIIDSNEQSLTFDPTFLF